MRYCPHRNRFVDHHNKDENCIVFQNITSVTLVTLGYRLQKVITFFILFQLIQSHASLQTTHRTTHRKMQHVHRNSNK